MSATFNVVYLGVSKRVETKKSDTVHQLIQECLKKHKVAAGMNGELQYNGKRLDSLLSIRLTNLANNSRLTLSVSKANTSETTSVNIKIMVSFPDGASHTFMQSVQNSILLVDLIQQIESSDNVKLQEVPGYQMKLSILNTHLSSLDERFSTASLRSIIGSGVKSLVIRISYSLTNNQKAIQEQQQIVKKQLEEQLRWNAKREAERAEVEKQEKEKQQALQPQTSQAREYENEGLGIINHTSGSDPATVSTSIPAPSRSAASTKPYQLPTVDTSNSKQSQIQPSTKPKSASYFLPSDKHEFYENDEDDYNMTVSQAQKYHKLVQDSAAKKVPKQRRKPLSYSVRVKFPDRSLLQLNFAADSKLGQLVKELDRYVLPPYKNKFNLKMAYPPFKTLVFSFLANNTRLDEHEEFGTNENIVLLWEVADTTTASGPFIDTKLVAPKQYSELPEIQLEAHRGQLPDDPVPKSTVKKSTWLQKTFK